MFIMYLFTKKELVQLIVPIISEILILIIFGIIITSIIRKKEQKEAFRNEVTNKFIQSFDLISMDLEKLSYELKMINEDYKPDFNKTKDDLFARTLTLYLFMNVYSDSILSRFKDDFSEFSAYLELFRKSTNDITHKINSDSSYVKSEKYKNDIKNVEDILFNKLVSTRKKIIEKYYY